MAVPFVQGHLTGRAVAATIDTECAHCGDSLAIEIDSALRHRVLTPGAAPLVSTPSVKASELTPSIIDGF